MKIPDDMINLKSDSISYIFPDGLARIEADRKAITILSCTTGLRFTYCIGKFEKFAEIVNSNLIDSIESIIGANKEDLEISEDFFTMENLITASDLLEYTVY